MDKRPALLLLLIFLLLPYHASADSNFDDKNEVFGFLKSAFQAQVSLSEKNRTMQEVDAVLDEYFSQSYKELFKQENLVQEGNSYRTYGSDFAPYYIPFYNFSDKTKVIEDEGKIYVVEFFSGDHEGPVNYEDHYEGLLLEKESEKWKVAEYMFDNIPESVLEKGFPVENEVKDDLDLTVLSADPFSSISNSGPAFSPSKKLIFFLSLTGKGVKQKYLASVNRDFYVAWQ
ncbi:DUF3993 domain-containing protein [Mesobacillus harenae]|uniref:DUF3993 domain-containing protein n=1 Tax=Mesobacillus harenae TaxID=2213203 RepID=UPI001581209F|nr:DUF3993 domain-containing protein [Mesobacillus harenae]